MRITNTNQGLKVMMTEEEFNTITDDGTSTSVSVVLSVNSLERFIAFSRGELPNGTRLNIIKWRDDSQNRAEPYFLVLYHKKWDIEDMPKFQPEQVMMKTSNSHIGVTYELARPKMNIAPRVYKNKPGPKPKPVQPVNSGGLPLVPPVDPEKEHQLVLMNDAAQRLTLKQAVDVINHYKQENGDNCILEVKDGKLTVMLVIG